MRGVRIGTVLYVWVLIAAVGAIVSAPAQEINAVSPKRGAQGVALVPAAVAMTKAELIYDLFGPPFRTNDFGYGPPWGQNEAPLDLAPSIDWRTGARPSAWNQSGSKEAVTAWGQIIAPVGGVGPSRNFRVQVRHMRLYVFSGGGWARLLDGDDLTRNGSWYNSNLRIVGRPSFRTESEGWSVPWASDAGWVDFHFWPQKWPRAALPAQPLIIFAYMEARLIKDTDPSVDLGAVTVYGSTGADYHNTTTSTSIPPVPGIGIARHKRLLPGWRSFSQITYPTSKPPKADALFDYVTPFNSLVLPPEVGP
jgi:hypothetical protein